MASAAAHQRDLREQPLLAVERSKSLLSFDPESGLAVPLVAVWMVYFALFMDNLGGQISTPVMPYYAKSFGVSYAAIGWLFSVFQFTGTFCAPVLGNLSDRFGRRRVLLLSLLGAGLASVGQGMATSFQSLFAWRGFGGIWGAVMPVAKVYMADVCSPAVLPEYMAYLSSVPGAAQTFGPGFGGGLSKFGLNIPLLVDGGLSFAIAVLVFFYLPESPAWQQQSTKTKAGSSGKSARIPGMAYALGICQLFFSMGLYSTNAMLPIVLSAKFGFDALHVGYTMTVIAIMRLVAGIWIAVPAMRHLGKKYACAAGSLATGSFLVCAVYVQNVWLCIAALAISRMGSNIRTSTFGALQAEVSQPEYRGRMFSLIQSFQNVGKLIGPLVTGYLAEIDAANLPFLFSGTALIICSLLEVAMTPGGKLSSEAGGSSSPGAVSGANEEGKPEDYDELGRYIGHLLKTRHYPWISQKERVRTMLDKLLPELSTDAEQHRLDMEELMTLAEAMPRLGDGADRTE